jgi:hypothetical protein
MSSRSRCAIVAGFPRSGSTWVATALSLAPGYTYYHEPDNFDAVPEANERFFWLYLTPEEREPAYLSLMARACAGRVTTAHTMWHDPGPLLQPFGERGRRLGERFPILFCRKRHVLLKLVYANLNLAWLSAHFPHAQQLYVLRHPCGQFESWRRLGWEPMPERLLRNERLMADHLHRFEDVLRRAAGYWERAGALWAATTYVIHRQTEAGGGPLVVAYEWLCADPMTRFQELYAQLGLAWNHKVERFLKSSDRSGDTQPYSLNRPSEMQIDKWKQQLTRGEIDACRQFVEPFELPYYPGFEPRITSLRGDRPERRSTSREVAAPAGARST